MEKSLDELFDELKKLPDWDRFPYPEVFYKHFNVKKPQPAAVDECAMYIPPRGFYEGPGETRPPAEGGVREIKEYQTLPVEVKLEPDNLTIKEKIEQGWILDNLESVPRMAKTAILEQKMEETMQQFRDAAKLTFDGKGAPKFVKLKEHENVHNSHDFVKEAEEIKTDITVSVMDDGRIIRQSSTIIPEAKIYNLTESGLTLQSVDDKPQDSGQTK